MARQKKLQEYRQTAGSPASGEPVFLAVGRLLRPHGLHGEMLMEIYTDFPERLKPGVRVFIGDDHRPISIRSRRGHETSFLIGLEGPDTPEEAGGFRNQIVYVRSDELPTLPDGEYYHHQLLGLRVVSDEGLQLGTLTGLLDTGSNDVIIVQSEAGKEILLPHIESVVRDIDLEMGEMRVHLLDGLLGD